MHQLRKQHRASDRSLIRKLRHWREGIQFNRSSKMIFAAVDERMKVELRDFHWALRCALAVIPREGISELCVTSEWKGNSFPPRLLTTGSTLDDAENCFLNDLLKRSPNRVCPRWIVYMPGYLLKNVFLQKCALSIRSGLVVAQKLWRKRSFECREEVMFTPDRQMIDRSYHNISGRWTWQRRCHQRLEPRMRWYLQPGQLSEHYLSSVHWMVDL